MNDRDYILNAIKGSRSEEKPLPPIVHRQFVNYKQMPDEELSKLFCQSFVANGGEVVAFQTSDEVRQFILEQKQSAGLSLNTIPEVGAVDIVTDDIDQLEKLEKLFIYGSSAVAENGAIWLDESAMPSRILPFITKELFVLIRRDQIVRNMHEAYNHIRIDSTGYGAFIAGPSKTADIEQSLVIGAHGAVRMVVMMVREKFENSKI